MVSVLALSFVAAVVGFDSTSVKFEGKVDSPLVVVSVINTSRKPVALIRGHGYYVKAFDVQGIQMTYPRYRKDVGVYFARPVERDWVVLDAAERTSWNVLADMKEGKRLKDAATIIVVRDKEISLDGTGETMGPWVVPSFVKKSKATMIRYPDACVVRNRQS